MGGRYRCRIWEGHVHTDIFKMVNQEPPVQPRELCSMLRGSLAGREVWGRMETGVCMAKSHCCAPTLSQGNTVNQLVQYRTRVFIKKNCFWCNYVYLNQTVFNLKKLCKSKILALSFVFSIFRFLPFYFDFLEQIWGRESNSLSKT